MKPPFIYDARRTEGPLIGALIVTHGQLAYELLNAARKIESGAEGDHIEAVPLEWTDTVDEAGRLVVAGGTPAYRSGGTSVI